MRYVARWLDMRQEDYIDDKDLQYVIKDAVVGGVCFSYSAMEIVMREKSSIHPLRIRPLVDEIYKNGCFRILDERGTIRCEGMEIDDFFKQSSFSKKLRFEHTVPYAFYVEALDRIHREHKLDTKAFGLCMKSINICIILEEENRKLDSMYKSGMPQGWQWGDDPFVRYRECGIRLWPGLSAKEIQ